MAKIQTTRSSVSLPISDSSPFAAEAKTAKTKPKRVKKDPSKYRRVTLMLPIELHFRLDAHATLRKKTLDGLAIDHIEQCCAAYKSDPALKAVFAENCRKTGESASESAA